MDSATRHRTLALLGILEERKDPRDGDGDGFYTPHKGAPDRTPLPPKPERMRRKARWFLNAPTNPRPRRPAPTPPTRAGDDAPRTMGEHLGQWHTHLDDLDDLVKAAESGAQASALVQHGGDVKAAQATFGDGSRGIITRYLGSPDRDPEDQADADQLVSTLARAFNIPAARVLRVDGDKTVSDIIDAPAWDDDDPDSDGALRLGVLDLLAGIDTRDPRSVAVDDGTPVVLQSADGFRDIALIESDDKRTRQRKQIAAAIDAAGAKGVSRTDISARVRNMPAPLRDELLAELVDSGEYALVPLRPGSSGHGARYTRVAHNEPLPEPASRAATDPPDDDGMLAFWRAFVQDGQWVDNPLTEEDALWLRLRLDDVKPEFERLGRPHWWQFASDRLDILIGHAWGEGNLFAR